ncbi:hypothetical protein I3215_28330 [Streptomyces sp. RB110-1]|uniref:hypothetical protein n=1 Tax=unclassified Streptomyces TaxID=2593676 RepID=UPI0019014241|nr:MULTISPECIES: hypothetical protein [unclassified Streptomyces]MBK0376731.1 hypothetical protein [Streptomyces sp. RB110-1]MBK0386895.1 hypothetical protein [Streptomyces sp. RB110-2]
MTPRSSKSEASVRTSLRWAALIVGATGCSDDGDGGTGQTVRSSAQVCDNALKSSGQAALKSIGGTDRYTELTGNQQNGEPYRFSTSLAAKRLHSEFSKRNKCAVYRADGENDFPLLDIEFEPRLAAPKKVSDPGAKKLIYPLGAFASVKSKPGSTYATLYFACPTQGPDGESSHVMASLFVPKAQAHPGSTPDDRMAVLNDVARGLAEELGCADEAGLPARVPSPTNG